MEREGTDAEAIKELGKRKVSNADTWKLPYTAKFMNSATSTQKGTVTRKNRIPTSMDISRNLRRNDRKRMLTRNIGNHTPWPN
jgi:hypothetical protein